MFEEFKIICLQLNKIGIIPTLMGSLGLECVSKETDLSPQNSGRFLQMLYFVASKSPLTGATAASTRPSVVTVKLTY